MGNMLNEMFVDLVKDTIMSGSEVTNHNGEMEVLDFVFLNGNTLDIEDFIEILAENNIRVFLQIEFDMDEYGKRSIKEILKMVCYQLGVKFSNQFVIKAFRICQKTMCDLFISPDPEEVPVIPTYDQMLADIENLTRINYLYIKLCQVVGTKAEPEVIYCDIIHRDNDNTDESIPNSTVFIGNYMQTQLFYELLERESNNCK